MHSTPDRQKKVWIESDEKHLQLPRESLERCRRLLAQLLHDLAREDLQERSDADDRQDSTHAS